MKKFIYEDVKLFHNVGFKKIPGAPPELVLFNKFDQEVERKQIGTLNREECNNLLLKQGFYKKESEDSPIPEEYLEGPYIPKDEL